MYTAAAFMQGSDATAMLDFEIIMKEIPITKIAVDPATITLAVNGTQEIKTTVEPSDTTETVVWSSDDETVATVDSTGKITAIAPGNATITVRSAGGAVSANVAVTVSTTVIPVEMIILSPDTLTLKPGETQKVTITVYPENATDKTLTWSADVADVAKIGEDGTVTALKEGTVKVTVKANNGVSATGTITVKADPIQPVSYEIIQGAKQVVISTASEAIFASDADFSKFVDVLLDGKVLPRSSYTAQSGSTIITLLQDTIKQLQPGVHTLTIKSSDGSATTTFTIEEPKTPPKTGDGANLGLWALLLLTAIFGVALTAKKARKQR